MASSSFQASMTNAFLASTTKAALVLTLAIGVLVIGSHDIVAQTLIPAPDRKEGEGLGPFETLVIKDAIVINGTGAPPYGPTNIVIKQNRIERVGGPMPRNVDHVIDAKGMYVLPGFIDMHAHCGSATKAPEAEYVYKLWMAHGVTTVRGVPMGPNDFVIKEKQRSEKNEIVAPRIFNYQRPPGNLRTPAEAKKWVQEAPLRGIEGLKLGSYRPEIMQAILDESKRQGLGSTAHLAQTGVAQMNAIDAARLGLDTVTHFYGHFEALMKDHVIQPWPTDQNYSDEQFRFGQVARLWDKIHPPGSDQWNAYLKEHLELGTVFDPTLTIYSASRDVMGARTAEWHDKYTDPSLWQYFQPSRKVHGSYWFYWTTHDEIAWKNFYQVWFRLLNDYKKMGGRITTGADSGFIYDTYGFAYIEELELLQEAGFHPLEVIQCATYNGAVTLHEPKKQPIQFGVIREGLLADLVIVPENPLENFKVLFGTGAVRLNEETDEPERVGGVRWTIKDGIAYDARQLLADVAEMVQKKKGKVDSTTAKNSLPEFNAVTTLPVVNGAAKESSTESKKKVATNTKSKSGSTHIYGSTILFVAEDHSYAKTFTGPIGEWRKVDLDSSGEKITPIASSHLVCLATDRSLYAYSESKGLWKKFTPKNGVKKSKIVVNEQFIFYDDGIDAVAFGVNSTEWAVRDETESGETESDESTSNEQKN